MASEAKVTKLTTEKPPADVAAVEKVRTATQKAVEDPAATPKLAADVLDEGVAQSSAQIEKGIEKMTRSAEGFYKASEEAVEFGRGNIEAVTKATQTYFSGLQDLSKQAFTVFQSLNEQAVQNAKALTSVKSVKEAAELQTSFAKAHLERTLAETTKLNEAAFKLAEQSSAPIAARITLAFEKFGRPTTFN